MKLPKHFAIKCPADYETNTTWKNYMKWLNTYAEKNGGETGDNWTGDSVGSYYGTENTTENQGTNMCSRISQFEEGTVKLTLEQWDKIVNNYKLPEKWYCVITKENQEILENWRKSVCSENYKGHLLLIGFSVISSHWLDDSYYFATTWTDSLTCRGYQEITTEQFIKYVLKQKEMKERKISPSNAQRVINIACPSWKEDLVNKWSKDIVLGNEINISEEFYQEMRKACTPSQNIVFDEIFGKNVEVYPDGTPCLVRGGTSEGWNLRYANGKGGFYNVGRKSGEYSTCSTWSYHMKLDINNLPVNE
jgi:hypothetical protein